MAFLSFSFLPVNGYFSIKIFLQVFKRNVKVLWVDLAQLGAGFFLGISHVVASDCWD